MPERAAAISDLIKRSVAPRQEDQTATPNRRAQKNGRNDLAIKKRAFHAMQPSWYL
jgi:hypothetical protein